MHKPVQVELQLDRLQLPYSETLGPIIAGGSPAHYRRRQPTLTTKKAPTTTLHDQPKAPYFSGDQIKPITFVRGKLLGTPGVP